MSKLVTTTICNVSLITHAAVENFATFKGAVFVLHARIIKEIKYNISNYKQINYNISNYIFHSLLRLS